MKILGLSLVLLCMVLSCLVEAVQAQTPSEPSKSRQPILEGPPPTPGFSILNYRADRRIWGATSDFYCAYMRTYRMQKKYRDSDVVSPAGYTTCVPANRFELRTTIQTETEPAPRE